MNRFFILFLSLFLSSAVQAYEVQGNIQLSEEWQPRVFLASISSPENLFVSSPEFVINEAVVLPNGDFLLNGMDLPAEPRFYRIYVVRSNLFSPEFTTDSVQSFMHLLLDNSTQLTLNVNSSVRLFGMVDVKGSEENSDLYGFESSYLRKKQALATINTAAKRDFQSQSQNRDIRDFVNRTSNPMVGLFALYHIEDRETDFLRNSNFYFNFQDRLKSSYPKAVYTNQFDNMLQNLIGYRDMVCEIPTITKPWRTWIIWGEALVILLLLFWIWKIKAQIRKDRLPDYSRLLTEKERRIWEGLASGKTNKEIASEFFIELSTVKTHINNLYKRLGVSSRKEAIALYNKVK
ncbi:response regulator transcription factor [Mangrovibacterium sp.]|uniref:response regulator transcription factor n=1 Tax=Mangrovibacterium sp. TaxID=1961364 RepID=UPI003563C1F6